MVYGFYMLLKLVHYKLHAFWNNALLQSNHFVGLRFSGALENRLLKHFTNHNAALPSCVFLLVKNMQSHYSSALEKLYSFLIDDYSFRLLAHSGSIRSHSGFLGVHLGFVGGFRKFLEDSWWKSN